MRKGMIPVVLLVMAVAFFSCEEKKEARQEKVGRKAAAAAKKQPPAKAAAKKQPVAKTEAKKPAAKPPVVSTQKPAVAKKPQLKPAVAKARKTPEQKKADEAAAREKAKKEAEAKKAAAEKARKQAEAKKATAEKARKEAEAKKAAKRVAKEKAKREAAAKKTAERAERKRKKREAEFGRFSELGITVNPTIKKVKLKVIGRAVTFRGVEVVSVKPGSIAAKAGLKKGDLIEGICDRPIYRLSNVVDGMLRAVPITDQLEEKHWTAAVAEGDAMTRIPQLSLVRDGAQRDLSFKVDTFRLNRDNYAMIVTRYENPLAQRTDVIGGALFCQKRARHFKSFAFFGPLFEVKRFESWKCVRLLVFLTWREGKVGDVAF